MTGNIGILYKESVKPPESVGLFSHTSATPKSATLNYRKLMEHEKPGTPDFRKFPERR